MIKSITPIFNTIQTKFQIKKPWNFILIIILSILITIPLFIIAHQNIVNLKLYWHLDRIFLFLLIAFLFYSILIRLRRIVLISTAVFVLFLLYGTIFGNYGFKTVIEEYQSVVYAMVDDPFPQDIIIDKLLPFPNKSKILNAIDFENPKVRNFALMATTKYFKDIKGYQDYRTTIQCFAVFKEINTNWNYVSDPKNDEYIAAASESVTYLSGDCDDHSILMAACIRSIGGTPRLIHTDGHIYPEILIGRKSQLEAINYLIKKILFEAESKKKSINYHIDERGQIWMNLDYTAKYPGGPFMYEEILGALTLN